MTSEVRTSAIVLAGGRASRFGSDKMAARLAGEPLLHHPLRAVAEVCDEVLVVAGQDGLAHPLPADLRVPARVVTDAEPFVGPLVALLAGAREAGGARLLVSGGDMPRLVPALLRRLLSWASDRDGACLAEGGWLRPLPCGLDRVAALDAASSLTEAGHRSLRDLIAALRVEVLAEAEWRPLDPQAGSLVDIDRPSDLETAEERDQLG
jgi:molybdenum cofactor guanylyltransferase